MWCRDAWSGSACCSVFFWSWRNDDLIRVACGFQLCACKNSTRMIKLHDHTYLLKCNVELCFEWPVQQHVDEQMLSQQSSEHCCCWVVPCRSCAIAVFVATYFEVSHTPASVITHTCSASHFVWVIIGLHCNFPASSEATPELRWGGQWFEYPRWR